jgi:hypothetical protein
MSFSHFLSSKPKSNSECAKRKRATHVSRGTQNTENEFSRHGAGYFGWSGNPPRLPFLGADGSLACCSPQSCSRN